MFLNDHGCDSRLILVQQFQVNYIVLQATFSSASTGSRETVMYRAKQSWNFHSIVLAVETNA